MTNFLLYLDKCPLQRMLDTDEAGIEAYNISRRCSTLLIREVSSGACEISISSGSQSPADIMPPADGRGAPKVICRANTTRTSPKSDGADLNLK